MRKKLQTRGWPLKYKNKEHFFSYMAIINTLHAPPFGWKLILKVCIIIHKMPSKLTKLLMRNWCKKNLKSFHNLPCFEILMSDWQSMSEIKRWNAGRSRKSLQPRGWPYSKVSKLLMRNWCKRNFKDLTCL